MARDIPAFLNIDVEPDGLQLPQHGPSTWDGYDALEPFVEDLRAALGDVAPARPRWAWFLRMDPQVEATSPSAAHAAVDFGDRIRRLEGQGDVFGIHVHPLRWNDGRGCWVHDFVDQAWVSECIVRSADAFGGAFGERPLRHRGVGAFLDGAQVATLDHLGVRVVCSAEPRTIKPKALVSLANVESGIDAAPAVGDPPETAGIPAGAYRPRPDDPLRPNARGGLDLVLLPLTASRRRGDMPKWWRAASLVRHRGKRPRVRMMFASVEWPDPNYYWDLVEAEVEAMDRPFVSIAIRTDIPDSPKALRTRAVLAALPSHPLARRLRFADPLEEAPSLLSRRARAGLSWASSSTAVGP